MKNLGTPNSLIEAIENGFSDSLTKDVEMTTEVIAAHVKDFIRQKLAYMFLKHSDSKEVMDALYELEAKLGCKHKPAEIKQLNQRIQDMVAAALAPKVSGE